jgi:hypothetical protein
MEPYSSYVVEDPIFYLLVQKLNEYMKVVEIAIVMVLNLVEDERTFSNLAFMKNKLCNRLTTHLDLCVHIFTYNVTNFPYGAVIATWMEICMKYRADGLGLPTITFFFEFVTHSL